MKNIIDFDAPNSEISAHTQKTMSPEIYEFVKFIVDRAGKSAVSIVNTCAMDDSPYWRAMFECGMADAISEDQFMENEFLGRMCAKPGLPHAHKLMGAYLQGMPEERRERLFSVAGLKKRGHHFSVCFYGASFKTSCGAHLLEVLKVMVAHGLPLQPLIDRNYAEIERATLLGHTEFLNTITSTGAKLPEDLFRMIMQRGIKDGRDIEIMSMLIDDCNVNVEELLSSKVIIEARSKARSYLNARSVRIQRIPESIVDPEEEDFLETT